MTRQTMIIAVVCVLAVAVTGSALVATARSRGETAQLRQKAIELEAALSSAERRMVDAKRPAPAVPAVGTLPAAGTGSAAVSAAPAGHANLVQAITDKDTRIGELEVELQNAQARLRVAEAKAAAAESEREDRRRSFRERMDQGMEALKQSDPERYQQIQAEREKMRAQMTDNMARRSAFVLGRDAKQMTEEQAANHQRLLEVMNENWQYTKVIEEQPDTEAASDARRALRENMGEMRDLLTVEREAALVELGRSIGYKDDAADFATTIQQIYDMTSMESMFPRRRGGPDGNRSRDGAQPPAPTPAVP